MGCGDVRKQELLNCGCSCACFRAGIGVAVAYAIYSKAEKVEQTGELRGSLFAS